MPETLRLALELAPLPNNFQGNPQQFAEAIVERLRVLFPQGVFTFVIQDTEPTSNVGPWIKDRKIYLWDEDEKRYLPLDISDSWQVAISDTEPKDPLVSPIWIKTTEGFPSGFFVYLDGEWVPIISGRGTTAERPVSPPDYTRYFDTEIETEIFYYRGLWKTVSGSPGDIKFVVYSTLAQALKFNPGWVEFGQVMGPARGRVFVPAHKDYGTDPAVDLAPLTGITSRHATQYWGEENITLTTPQMPRHWHGAWDRAVRVNYNNGSTGGDGENLDVLGQNNAEAMLTQNAGESQPHPNMQPTIALWCLIKN